jgi:hypothetical protein
VVALERTKNKEVYVSALVCGRGANAETRMTTTGHRDPPRSIPSQNFCSSSAGVKEGSRAESGRIPPSIPTRRRESKDIYMWTKPNHVDLPPLLRWNFTTKEISGTLACLALLLD